MPPPPTEITIDGDRYFHVKEAAQRARVVRDYMSRLCHNGTLRALRIGNVWHVQVASLNALLRDRVERKQELRKKLAELRREEQRLAGHPSALFA
jgi:excisionase family DNA binding protein